VHITSLQCTAGSANPCNPASHTKNLNSILAQPKFNSSLTLVILPVIGVHPCIQRAAI
jgi:hypothetical protein